MNNRRKFRSQTSDDMDRWKSRGGKSQRREEERRSEMRKSQKTEYAGARKGSKVAKHGVFPLICGSGGSKNRLAKPSGEMRDEKLHAVAKHISKSKCAKHTMLGALLEVAMYAAVARTTFPSQKCASTHQVWSTFGSWDVGKSARRCGTKHVSKSKC